MRYDNPVGIIVGVVVMQAMVVLCLAMRFHTRQLKKSGIMTSDWLILAAAVCGVALSFIEIYGVSKKALAYPLNATLDDPAGDIDRLITAEHLELSFLIIGILAVGLIKISATFLYWQLFAQVRFRRVLIIWIVILTGWTVAFILAGLLECGSHLMALFGTPDDYVQYCGAAEPSGWANVGSDVATDFITLIIPIPVILSLHLPLSRKLLVLATFMIGALSVGASIMKAYIYIKGTLDIAQEDGILVITGMSIWNLAEVQIGIIAACGPTLRFFLSQWMQTKSMRSLLSYFRDLRSTKRGTEDEPSLIKGNSTTQSSEQLHRSSKDSTHVELEHQKSRTVIVSEV